MKTTIHTFPNNYLDTLRQEAKETGIKITKIREIDKDFSYLELEILDPSMLLLLGVSIGIQASKTFTENHITGAISKLLKDTTEPSQN